MKKEENESPIRIVSNDQCIKPRLWPLYLPNVRKQETQPSYEAIAFTVPSHEALDHEQMRSWYNVRRHPHQMTTADPKTRVSCWDRAHLTRLAIRTWRGQRSVTTGVSVAIVSTSVWLPRLSAWSWITISGSWRCISR